MGKRKRAAFTCLLSYLTVLGFCVDLSITNSEEALAIQLLKALGGFSVAQLFLLAGVYALYAYAFQHLGNQSWTKRDKACVIIPAVLFAFFMVIGASFAKTDSWDLVLGSPLQTVKSAFAFIGYAIAFSVSIAEFYTWLSNLPRFDRRRQPRRRGLLGRYKYVLAKYPFRTAFLTLLILYLPYAVLSYPAIFMGDTGDIVMQGFNFPAATSQHLILVDENVKLNGHHPVVYTVFVHICLVAGKSLLGSYNAGIFFVSLCQLLAACAVMAAAIRLLEKIGVHVNILMGVLAYFAFAPRIRNYMFLITKDIFAMCALLLFVLSAFQMLRGQRLGKWAAVELTLWGVAMGLLRNDGKYIILGSVVILWLMVKEHRKTLLISGLAIAVALGAFSNVLMPALHITPTSKREALSVPFQQTARYFRDHGQDVTPAERAAVSAVLDVDTLGARYDPDRSDLVKATFREDATAQELAAYFSTWFKMGLKHPDVYIQATWNNYYGYLYPGEVLATAYSYNWSETCMNLVNDTPETQDIGCSFYYPESLDAARTTFETLREDLFELPVLSLLKSPAAYVWALALLVFYLAKERAWRALALTAPLVLSVAICFLGPCNGAYFRYLYGVSVCLPVVYLLCLSLMSGKGPAKK